MNMLNHCISCSTVLPHPSLANKQKTQLIREMALINVRWEKNSEHCIPQDVPNSEDVSKASRTKEFLRVSWTCSRSSSVRFSVKQYCSNDYNEIIISKIPYIVSRKQTHFRSSPKLLMSQATLTKPKAVLLMNTIWVVSRHRHLYTNDFLTLEKIAQNVALTIDFTVSALSRYKNYHYIRYPWTTKTTNYVGEIGSASAINVDQIRRFSNPCIKARAVLSWPPIANASSTASIMT